MLRVLALGIGLSGLTLGAGAPLLADVKAGVDAWAAGDFERAIREWKPLADQGDPDAQFNLAQAYRSGRGVPLDLDKAETLYGAAAAKGHIQASDIYGLLLFQRGDRAKALPYLQASAGRGDARAQYILGVAHFNGELVAKDWVRAYALVSLAQQAGLPQATNALKQMDQHIPLADRQKSVLMAVQIASDAEATRQREAASANLANGAAPPKAGAPQIAAAAPPSPAMSLQGSPASNARKVANDALRANSLGSPADAGADFTRPKGRVAGTTAPAPPARPVASNVAQPLPAPTPVSTPVSPPGPSRTRAATGSAAPAPVRAGGPWRVQLGAFSVLANAENLWRKLAGRPELSGHPKTMTAAGRLTKLQAGGFASRADAAAACRGLTAAGFVCVPARD